MTVHLTGDVALLLTVRTVAAIGDGRNYDQRPALRAATSAAA